MTTAAQPDSRHPKPESRSAAQRLPGHLLKALHAEWRKFSPGLQGSDEWQVTSDEPDPERALRLAWTNQVLQSKIQNLKSKIESWSELTVGQARYLLKKMRAELGESPLNDYIARAALRLFGSGWNEALAERIGQRFHRGPEIQALEFWQKKALFEELVGRMARQDQVAPTSASEVCGTSQPSASALAARTEALRMEIVRQKS